MKKILTIVLLIMALLAVTAAGHSEENTFTGEAQGFGGPVTVTLTVEDGKITGAVVTGEQETPGIGAAAVEPLAEQILSAQSAEIDGVAGATITSGAAKEAAAKALNAANGTAAEAAALKDGVYTATRESFQLEHVTVSVTIAGGKIADVVIDEITDHPTTITDTPCAVIPAAIVANQTYNVDGVTGATFTSNSIKNAVRDCLEQAGGSDVFSAPVEKPEIVKAEDIETDILVVGGGAAGMSAALEAYSGEEAGTPGNLRVTLIEKAGFLGGSTSVSGGGFLKYLDETGAYDDAWEERCMEDDLQIIHKDMQSPFNSDLHRSWFSVMKRTNDILDANGIGNFLAGYVSYFTPPAGGEDKKWAGSYITKYVNSFIGDTGIDLHLNTAMTGLLTNEQGEIVGVSVQDKTSTYNIYAKKVILACGGFPNNRELIAQYAPDYNRAILFCEATNTGDGFKMAVDLGAGVVGDQMFVEIGVDGMTGIRPDWCMDYLWNGAKYMLVNTEAERFCNEFQTGYNVATEITHKTENVLSWAIVDAANAKEHNVGSEFDFEHGYLFSADTIEDLAGKIEIPADKLVETVAAYNAAASGQVEDTFGGTPETMDSVDEGPYYALKMRPCMITSLVAVAVDGECHVLKENGKPIPNLFAAGDMILGNVLHVYNSGHGVGNALYSGNICAKTAKAEIQ
ncbi:MAG: FAD-dependent oxidoreductase [Clostridiales bacterium]|nr:FAD-dependent oxidoreductase [Clostridiales bacterium]